METSGRISNYRDRLDKTLASPDLTNAAKLKTLIKNQLQTTFFNGDEECGEKLLERRTKEVSYFIEMLRSASSTGSANKASEKPEWKLKQDNEELRVMYREGPPGTPFHTLLVESYVDGPIDACLCVAWESALYKKWCPQHKVPTFKIVSSKCLHKIRIGEQISMVRVKVSWPLLPREAVVNFFVFEYFQEDLMVVVLNTIDESEIIGRRDMIPEAKGAVRVDAVGGFAIQKVSSKRSYFRAIANMDLKLGFVPPSLINFMSRQLVGSGLKHYQKTVGSVFNSDEDFKKALLNPLYNRIRETLYRSKEQNSVVLENNEIKIDATDVLDSHHVEVTEDVVIHDDSKEAAEEASTNNDVHTDQNDGGMTSSTCSEIEEEEVSADNDAEEMKNTTSNRKRKVCISPEVEQALGTLESVIHMVQEYGFNARDGSSSSYSSISSTEGLERSGETESTWEVSDRRTAVRSSGSEDGSSNRELREVNNYKVAPAVSWMKNLVVIPLRIKEVFSLHSSEKGNLDSVRETKETTFVKDRGIRGNGLDVAAKKKKSKGWRKYRFWCFNSSSYRRSID